MISFLLSILLHTAAWLVVVFMPKPSVEHVFLLVDYGEEAVEMETGSFINSKPSAASLAAPPPEKRFEPKEEELPVVKRDDLPILDEETKPVILEQADVAQDRVEMKPERKERSRAHLRDNRQVNEPEVHLLSPPKLATSEDGFLAPGEVEGIRAVEFTQELRQKNIPALAPEKKEEFLLAIIPPIDEINEPPPAKLEKLERRRSDKRQKREMTPERESPPVVEQRDPQEVPPESASASDASQASEALRAGAAHNVVRGVRQRARPQGVFQLVYPYESRQRGESGQVLIAASVGLNGRCLSARIERSSGYPELDQAALSTVMRAPFQPATIDGRPVETEERIEIVFELH